ncbi:MAG: hypothetical protein A3F12_08130 [Gammaproteobacteria bacterium RIFCSPHIGHO2_12_FULL_38_14]|nr:MAG: hypothetical protein A3F12_08130 [Gammaproteobacteria bacterium RIFCSPHIGHO2_12_FULL_38_14]
MKFTGSILCGLSIALCVSTFASNAELVCPQSFTATATCTSSAVAPISTAYITAPSSVFPWALAGNGVGGSVVKFCTDATVEMTFQFLNASLTAAPNAPVTCLYSVSSPNAYSGPPVAFDFTSTNGGFTPAIPGNWSYGRCNGSSNTNCAVIPPSS